MDFLLSLPIARFFHVAAAQLFLNNFKHFTKHCKNSTMLFSQIFHTIHISYICFIGFLYKFTHIVMIPRSLRESVCVCMYISAFDITLDLSTFVICINNKEIHSHNPSKISDDEN